MVIRGLTLRLPWYLFGYQNEHKKTISHSHFNTQLGMAARLAPVWVKILEGRIFLKHQINQFSLYALTLCVVMAMGDSLFQFIHSVKCHGNTWVNPQITMVSFWIPK